MRKHIRTLTCLILLWIVHPLMANPLCVGVFDVDVSPPVGSPLAYDPCKAVAMSLRACGVVIVGNEQPVVLCAVDWIGIANEGHHEWCQALADAVGTTPDRVAIHTVHQHDAPFCDLAAESLLASRGLAGQLFDTQFVQQSIAKVAQAAASAKERATPVTHVGLGAALVEKVASNRRLLGEDGKVRATRYTSCADPKLRAEPEGTIDPRVKSISFWNENEPVVVLTYYATHPQSYYRRGIANPDFPGMARFLRQVTLNGLPHVHFNGAGGNIGAGKYNDGSPENRQLLTQRLANGMNAAWKATERHPVTSADMRWQSCSVPIKAAPHLNEEELQKTLDDDTQTNAIRQAAATNLAWLRRCEQSDPVFVSCLHLGPASILHLPGEAVVEYQLWSQEIAPDQFVAVAAYGDYGPGYICLESHYEQGGYEASPQASRVSPQTEAALKEAIRSAFDRS